MHDLMGFQELEVSERALLRQATRSLNQLSSPAAHRRALRETLRYLRRELRGLDRCIADLERLARPKSKPLLIVNSTGQKRPGVPERK